MWTWNQLGINTWEFFVLYCLSQRGRRIVFMLSVRKHDRSCPTGLFLWLKMITGQHSTRHLWNIFKLPLLYVTHFVCETELSNVYAQHGCCSSQHLISEGLCSVSCSEQVYELRQSEAPVHRCTVSCQWRCSCKLPTSPLEPHVLVGCLSSFMPYWTLTVSPVTAELLWSSQSSTAGNDLAESPCSLPSGVLLTSDLLALLSP